MCGDGPVWNSVQSPCFENIEIISFQAKQGDWQIQSGYFVDHCIAERGEEMCSFQGNITSIAIVAAFNLVQAILMFTGVLRLRKKPLLVLGDAISSFLSRPDTTTFGLCLLSREDVTDRKLWPSKLPLEDMKHYTMIANLPAARRFKAVSAVTLWNGVSALLVTLLMILGLLFQMYQYVRRAYAPDHYQFSVVSIGTFSFGAPNPLLIVDNWSLFSLSSEVSQTIVSGLVANLPQLLLSLSYILINHYLTAMYIAEEWNKFSDNKSGLRVTDPEPLTAQSSSHYLQLPCKIVFPLIGAYSVLHWLLSMSIFIAVIQDYNADGVLINGLLASTPLLQNGAPQRFASCGFSPIPAVVFLGILGLMLFYILGISLRKIPPGMPVVGSCSAAISAACHAPTWDMGCEMKTLLWGSVKDPNASLLERYATTRHCSFNSSEVESVVAGGEYN